MNASALYTNRSRLLVKTLATVACIFGLAMGASGQGLVNFFNNSTTLVSLTDWWQTWVMPANAPGTYYFGLLTAPQGSTEIGAFTFSGVYGTNQAAAGRFSGGANVTVPGWQAGQTRAIMVVGWPAAQGHDFDPIWLQGLAPLGIGLSSIAPGLTAGGFDGTGTLPTQVVFGGSQGIPRGFQIFVVPEPSVFALLFGGAFTALSFRRKAGRKNVATS